MMGCARCAALVRCRSRVVPGDGAVPAMVAFVGIAPGRLGGDRTGIPFSGDRSGKLLRRMIALSRIERVFITNLVRCNPRDARGRNRDPRANEIANCRGYLAAELALVHPRVIVALGAAAWRELAGAEARFNPCRPRAHLRGAAIVYPMYHPGYVVRGARSERAYTRDFARLARLIKSALYARRCGTQTPAPPEWRFHARPAAIGISDDSEVSTTGDLSRSLGALRAGWLKQPVFRA